MERVIQIGIYDYINEQFPGPKENKVIYYKILIKRPQFLSAHMEWLYNNTDVFLGQFLTRLKDWGIKEYVNTYYYGLSDEKIREEIELYENIIRLNDTNDEEYGKTKYNTQWGLCRSHSENIPLTEHIRSCGLYAYLETYGGLTTGNKLKTYYEMITSAELFESHCQALLQPCIERVSCRYGERFPPYDIDLVFT